MFVSRPEHDEEKNGLSKDCDRPHSKPRDSQAPYEVMICSLPTDMLRIVPNPGKGIECKTSRKRSQ